MVICVKKRSGFEEAKKIYHPHRARGKYATWLKRKNEIQEIMIVLHSLIVER